MCIDDWNIDHRRGSKRCSPYEGQRLKKKSVTFERLGWNVWFKKPRPILLTIYKVNLKNHKEIIRNWFLLHLTKWKQIPVQMFQRCSKPIQVFSILHRWKPSRFWARAQFWYEFHVREFSRIFVQLMTRLEDSTVRFHSWNQH